MDRRAFLRNGATLTGGLLLAEPLQAYAFRLETGADCSAGGYGPLIDMGDLALPEGFGFRIISREGDPMTDGNPTPGIFDGMAAFPGSDGTTILIRNHENRGRQPGETAVMVPAEKRYDDSTTARGGCTKLVVSAAESSVVESFAVLGGTSTNCAGGSTPWESWLTCEEVYETMTRPHGYIFEIPADATGPVDPAPIRAAGRFVHEAVAWHDGRLYETEDREESCFYRFRPDAPPITGVGQLAAATGKLQALRVKGHPSIYTSRGWRHTFGGRGVEVEWVTVDDPEPPEGVLTTDDWVRGQALAKGAAVFERQEGIWVAGNRLYFVCTTGGDSNNGQIWEYNPRRRTLRLVFESPSTDLMTGPDNITRAPLSGHLIICQDSPPDQHLRGLTPDGCVYDFARAVTNGTEFCGACFDASGKTLYVNQQGNRGPVPAQSLPKYPAVTYAIEGPWEKLAS